MNFKSPRAIHQAILNLFSEDGLEVSGFVVKAKSPTDISIINDGKLVEIKFPNNKPRAEITRLITFYAHVEQINIGEEGGLIKLRNFPDFSFSYDSNLFSHNAPRVDCGAILEEIDNKYSEKQHKQIAKKCLQYAEEWATICHQTGITFNDADYADRYVLYNNCYDYVAENIEADVEKRYGSVILTWLFVYVVLPMIIKWIVNKVLERLFNN
jgi:hypothetical protein